MKLELTEYQADIVYDLIRIARDKTLKDIKISKRNNRVITPEILEWPKEIAKIMKLFESSY